MMVWSMHWVWAMRATHDVAGSNYNTDALALTFVPFNHTAPPATTRTY